MSLKSKIDTIINDATSTPDGLPGVVIAAVNRDGDVIYEGAAGERQLGSGKPMTVDSVFWIASFTKLVTTICAMQLVEQGKIDLDEPVEKFVPEISKPQILEGFDANGQPILRDAKVKITLRHLLTHTSGHTYDFFNPNHKKWNDENHVPDSFSTEDSVNYAPRAREAGESWEYGLAIDWAGKVVEKISGMRLNDYMQKNIMQPLGLKSTNFNLTPDMRSRMAGMHQRDSSGKLTATDMSINKTAKEYVGGAGLWSCAHDYLTILTVLLNNGKAPKSGAQILKPETVKEMLTPQLKGQPAVDVNRPFIDAIKEYTNPFAHLATPEDVENNWGLSFAISKGFPTGKNLTKIWWAGIANCFWFIDLESGTAGCILTQILPFADGHVVNAWMGFEAALFAEVQK